MDLPGLGASTAPEGFDFTPENISAVLVKWLDGLGVSQADVVGNSLGGSLTLYLAANHPEYVRSIVPVDPAAYDSGRHSLYRFVRRHSWLTAAIRPLIGPWTVQFGVRQAFHNPETADAVLVDQMNQPFVDPNYPARLIEIGADYFSAAFQTLPRDYRNIKAPALIVWGEDDKLIPVQPSGPDLNAALPDSILVVMEKAGHLPYQEKPEEFNHLLLDFLKGRQTATN